MGKEKEDEAKMFGDGKKYCLLSAERSRSMERRKGGEAKDNVDKVQ
jgi:hypothetical protein